MKVKYFGNATNNKLTSHAIARNVGRGKRSANQQETNKPCNSSPNILPILSVLLSVSFQNACGPYVIVDNNVSKLKMQTAEPRFAVLLCPFFPARKGYDSFNRREKVTVGEDLIKATWVWLLHVMLGLQPCRSSHSSLTLTRKPRNSSFALYKLG